MNANLKRYDLYGWDYEYYNHLSDDEINWYITHARKTGGPVLELACGSGRLLISLAKAGFKVKGVDLSESMRNLAGGRISGLSPEVASRIQLDCMDITEFQLDSAFGLIILADNSFGVLTTRKQQRACLGCIFRHLKPDGLFLLTIHCFDNSRFINGRRIINWSEPFIHPVTGDSVQRRGEFRIDDSGKQIHGIFFYKTLHIDGNESIEKCCFTSPIMETDDYLLLLAEAGFHSNIYAGYEKEADNGESSILNFVCRKHR